MQDRYFYHSFPRRGKATTDELTKGCAILTAIRDIGLLLTPQLIEWEQPVHDGKPRTFPVLQKRVCFTELAPQELSAHAERFGHFALEFEIETVRRLGAVPVFYVPQPSQAAADGSVVGTMLLAIAMDSAAVIERMAHLNEILHGATPVAERLDLNIGFARSPDGRGTYSLHRDEAKTLLAAIGHAVTPWNDLRVGAHAILNFFHPTDNLSRGREMEYYREREWRIACAFRLNHADGTHTDVLRLATAAERNRILAIDPEFFGRQIKTDTVTHETLDQVLVHPGLNGTPILDMARRVIVPGSAVDQVQDILKSLANPPPVVSLDDANAAGARASS